MLCVGIAVPTQSLGLSLVLCVFLAGFILSESDYSHQAVAVMLPFRDVLMSLFFVSIGMLLNVRFLLAHPWQIALLTAGVVLIKPLVGTIASLQVGLHLRNAVLAGMALGQVGEFSLVATKAGVTAGLLSQDIFQTVLDVVVLSMIATSRLREDYGVNVLAVMRDGDAIGNPPGELAFQQGDVLFVIGPTDWDADQIT